jgi:hypothetical protein
MGNGFIEVVPFRSNVVYRQDDNLAPAKRLAAGKAWVAAGMASPA